MYLTALDSNLFLLSIYQNASIQEQHYRHMKTQSLINYYYINLASATERRAEAEQQAEKFGLELHRIDAVAGKDLDIPSLSAYNAKRRLSEFAAELSPNQHACIMSHLKALQTFVDSGAKYGVIMEDDFQLHPQFNEGIAWLTEHTSGWEALKLWTGDGKIYPLHKQLNECPWSVVFPKKLPWVAVGNIYTQQGAQRILNGFKSYWLGYDAQWAWVTLVADSIPCCGISPSLVVSSDPHNKKSTIDAEANSRVAAFAKQKKEQTWKQYIFHRLCVWAMATGKLRMRAKMKSLLKFN